MSRFPRWSTQDAWFDAYGGFYTVDVTDYGCRQRSDWNSKEIDSYQPRDEILYDCHGYTKIAALLEDRKGQNDGSSAEKMDSGKEDNRKNGMARTVEGKQTCCSHEKHGDVLGGPTEVAACTGTDCRHDDNIAKGRFGGRMEHGRY